MRNLLSRRSKWLSIKVSKKRKTELPMGLRQTSRMKEVSQSPLHPTKRKKMVRNKNKRISNKSRPHLEKEKNIPQMYI